jgi:hypothetical protein
MVLSGCMTRLAHDALSMACHGSPLWGSTRTANASCLHGTDLPTARAVRIHDELHRLSDHPGGWVRPHARVGESIGPKGQTFRTGAPRGPILPICNAVPVTTEIACPAHDLTRGGPLVRSQPGPPLKSHFKGCFELGPPNALTKVIRPNHRPIRLGVYGGPCLTEQAQVGARAPHQPPASARTGRVWA